MDSDAVFAELRDALASEAWREAEAAALALTEWLTFDGDQPSGLEFLVCPPNAPRDLRDLVLTLKDLQW
tara:strand:+ start:418 stop:624 length:207 start_codon:yes stop_codon:yes gene_type:complete